MPLVVTLLNSKDCHFNEEKKVTFCSFEMDSNLLFAFSDEITTLFHLTCHNFTKPNNRQLFIFNLSNFASLFPALLQLKMPATTITSLMQKYKFSLQEMPKSSAYQT